MKSGVAIREYSDTGALQILSFSALEEKVSLFLPDNAEPLIDREDRIAAVLTAISFGFVILATALKPSTFTSAMIFVALGIEIASFCFMVTANIRKTMPQILNRRNIFANELDQRVQGFSQIVIWLRTFPKSELERKLYYVRKRLEVLLQRGGFIFGGLERLGFLPALVALYLQFKDTTWAWPPDFKISSSILGLAIFVIYLVGLYFISIKWQLLSYIRYLEMATDSTLPTPDLQGPDSNIP